MYDRGLGEQLAALRGRVAVLRANTEGAEEQFDLILEEVERVLRHDAAYREALFAETGGAIVVLAADGAITYISAALAQLLGYSLEPEERIVWADIIHPEDLERASAILQRALALPGIR